MILADTSAWVEFLRGTQSPVDMEMRRLVVARAGLCTTEAVVMEVLAGVASASQAASLRRLLLSGGFVANEGLVDHEEAAALYRHCRAAGATIRSLIDCLIAAVALRAGVAILHRDRDFEVLAEHCGLKVVQPS